MAIKSTLIHDAFTAIFTSPMSGDSSAVTAVYLCNIGAGPVTVNIHAVPFGDTVSSANIIYYNLEITSEDTYVIDSERLILNASDSIVAIASEDEKIVATVSYLEI